MTVHHNDGLSTVAHRMQNQRFRNIFIQSFCRRGLIEALRKGIMVILNEFLLHIYTWQGSDRVYYLIYNYTFMNTALIWRSCIPTKNVPACIWHSWITTRWSPTQVTTSNSFFLSSWEKSGRFRTYTWIEFPSGPPPFLSSWSFPWLLSRFWRILWIVLQKSVPWTFRAVLSFYEIAWNDDDDINLILTYLLSIISPFSRHCFSGTMRKMLRNLGVTGISKMAVLLFLKINDIFYQLD